MQDPTSDGGQWDMLVNLINKYGLMPKKCFPETYSCEASLRLNAVLKSKVWTRKSSVGCFIWIYMNLFLYFQLREYAKILRDLVENSCNEDDIRSTLDSQMLEIYRVVGICLGIPDEKFRWEYYDKSKAYQCIGPIKPIDFYQKYVKQCFNVDDKVEFQCNAIDSTDRFLFIYSFVFDRFALSPIRDRPAHMARHIPLSVWAMLSAVVPCSTTINRSKF